MPAWHRRLDALPCVKVFVSTRRHGERLHTVLRNINIAIGSTSRMQDEAGTAAFNAPCSWFNEG